MGSKQYICHRRRSSSHAYCPFTSNFPGSQAGQSFKALLNVRHPSLDDDAKIRNLFESCTIVS